MDAKERGNDQEVRRRRKEQRLRPSSKASREAAASRTTSDGSQPPFGKTHRSCRLRLVITRTFPAALAIGIAQHTIRGLARPFVLMAKNDVGVNFRKAWKRQEVDFFLRQKSFTRTA